MTKLLKNISSTKHKQTKSQNMKKYNMYIKVNVLQKLITKNARSLNLTSNEDVSKTTLLAGIGNNNILKCNYISITNGADVIDVFYENKTLKKIEYRNNKKSHMNMCDFFNIISVIENQKDLWLCDYVY